ncbi:hypothetical protein AZI87_05970 [Bdellovibrio bacteriovorus]|uniref:Secreted protein n=1 Tax=Bdellovibrio bacteriovorus TaxID=959 RepID=A0A162GRE8_BDEBC|nr:hypothetical protein [Bdellovibrio bacteriovorus]KYG68775.1 hypothetical protein AZI87_05970 [Bdellovibrio bacteriovorus]
MKVKILLIAALFVGSYAHALVEKSVSEQEIKCVEAADVSYGLSDVSFKVIATELSAPRLHQVSYDLEYSAVFAIAGKCPSRNCGSTQYYNHSGTSINNVDATAFYNQNEEGIHHIYLKSATNPANDFEAVYEINGSNVNLKSLTLRGQKKSDISSTLKCQLVSHN